MLMRRPLPFALAATALMLLIASPALVLKENTAAIAMFPKDFETRVGLRARGAAARRRRARSGRSSWSFDGDRTSTGFARRRTSSRCPA